MTDPESLPKNLTSQSERLAWARALHFPSPRAAAVANNWNPNTYKSHEGGIRRKSGLTEDDLRRYAKAFRVPLGWLAGGQSQKSDYPIHSNESHSGKPLSTLSVIVVSVIGQAKTNHYSKPGGADDVREIPYVNQRFSPENLFAIEIADESVNRRYANGVFVVCANQSEIPISLDKSRGRFVAIRTYEGEAEGYVIRRVVSLAGRMAFAPYSTNQYDLLEPADGERIDILGTVVFQGAHETQEDGDYTWQS